MYKDSFVMLVKLAEHLYTSVHSTKMVNLLMQKQETTFRVVDRNEKGSIVSQDCEQFAKNPNYRDAACRQGSASDLNPTGSPTYHMHVKDPAIKMVCSAQTNETKTKDHLDLGAETKAVTAGGCEASGRWEIAGR